AALTGLTALTVLAGLPRPSGPPHSERVEPAVSAPVSPGPAASRVRIVDPYEPVTLTPELRLGLLPEGRQNYVIAEAEQFPEALEHARAMGLGDSLRPRSISTGYDSTDRDGIQRIEGAWRLPEPPRRIVVTVAGAERRAELFTLPGDPGWGVYHLDTTGLPRFTSFTITARDHEGEVFATRDIDLSLPKPGTAGPGAGP
ncbi:hypothetical protein, partial [Streptomyces sparsus]